MPDYLGRVFLTSVLLLHRPPCRNCYLSQKIEGARTFVIIMRVHED